MWDAMKSFQVVFWLRLGAGWIPYRRRMLPNMSDRKRRGRDWPGSDDAVVSPAGVFSGEAHNEGFQFRRDRGRPAWKRCGIWSRQNLRAMSRRYQARMVSGFGDTGDLLKCKPGRAVCRFQRGSIARDPKGADGREGERGGCRFSAASIHSGAEFLIDQPGEYANIRAH